MPEAKSIKEHIQIAALTVLRPGQPMKLVI